MTGRCQLTCPGQCYAEAGPTRGHGPMATADWIEALDEAAALGVTTVQLVGGEPTLHPDFTRLVEHALEAGLTVRILDGPGWARVRAQVPSGLSADPCGPDCVPSGDSSSGGGSCSPMG
ncbi:radical SAM protein [Streptomyces sp. NPDC090303]|uniref:radical SAM protein n=1 Tax=Streptomyces sp. NPDC090303 TaxID=3365960 RepID=UPI003816D2D0